MKILYIHGAFSAFKPDSEKVKNLQKVFEVVGVSYSMETPYPENKAMLVQFCRDNGIDAVVGTSLGGLYAAEVSAELSIPAILINPCVEPVMSLSTIVGTMTNFATGKPETLTQEIVNTFPDTATMTQLCLVFVGMKDELINPSKTIFMCCHKATVVANHNADHYWDDFERNERILIHLDTTITA
ncbi:hypothetical protein OTK49_21445 [Vibrio coralliirubri]|uniref:YqiA/YcfP family alpha/beta fold hydrolase n=1 Tax=Vibrio coralliirubri TaxID=1516159 RepID=UPI00228370B4|nr:YqiA/YcfP family alpha/beta fold hydrolase [Vibrio coralliirubri]MCY9865087.1 hypothetical protein [Vibrio coralliirubri]